MRWTGSSAVICRRIGSRNRDHPTRPSVPCCIDRPLYSRGHDQRDGEQTLLQLGPDNRAAEEIVMNLRPLLFHAARTAPYRSARGQPVVAVEHGHAAMSQAIREETSFLWRETSISLAVLAAFQPLASEKGAPCLLATQSLPNRT